MGLLVNKDCTIIISLCCAAMSGGYLVYMLHKSQQLRKKKYKESSKQPAEIPHLPLEIVAEILSYSSVKDFWRCKCVRKEWNTLVKDRNFTTKFMQRKSKYYSHNSVSHSYDPEEGRTGIVMYTNLLATCDGLSLKMDVKMDLETEYTSTQNSGIDFTSKLFITNEQAHQRLYIPVPHVKHCRKAYAIVFIPTTGEYKVVSIFFQKDDEKCAVLTLGSDDNEHKWRFLDILESHIQSRDKTRYLQVGTYFHCIAEDTNAYEICSLNMCNECFTVVNVSKGFIPKGKKHWVINWNESLGFVYMDYDARGVELAITSYDNLQCN